MMERWNRTTAVWLFVVMMIGACAALKTATRTVNDIASDLCVLFATENAEQLAALPENQGASFNPEAWCAVQKHLDPFIDEVLAGKRAAGAALGITQGGEDAAAP